MNGSYVLVFLCTLAAALTACGASEHSEVLPDALRLQFEHKEIDREAPHPVSYASMVNEGRSSVVSVYTATIVQVPREGAVNPQELFMRRFFGMPMPRQPEPEELEEKKLPQGIGSGVIVTEDGYVLTNNHVVTDQHGQDADEILVQLGDGRELPAKIVGRDANTDVAVLKIDATDLPAIRIADSDQLLVGDVVFAIGNPLGVGLTVTKGIVSAKGRQLNLYGREGYESFIQTDASINPGNSGGALIDIEGRLVGINSAILSRSGGNIGIGFAIPSDLAVNVMQSLLQYGEVRRGFLGVSISDLTPEKAEAFGLDAATQGVLVDRVEKDLPADKAGIRRGDVMVSLNGEPVVNSNEVRLKIAQQRPGSEVIFSLIRNGEAMEVSVLLGDLEKMAGNDNNVLFEGVLAEAISDEARQHYKIPDGLNGLLIAKVDPASPFSRYLREGMVLLEVNDRRVSTAEEAHSFFHPGMNKLYIYDRGALRYLALRVN